MSKSKEGEALTKVLKYMTDQNRPYSAGDVMTNMHKEFNKPCIQRTLDQLVSAGKLKEKTYGKQKIYVVDQSLFPDVDENEITKMDEQITRLQEKMKTLESECVAMETKLSALKNSLTMEEAQQQLKELEQKCSELNERLIKAKENSKGITSDQTEKIHKDHQVVVTQWRKRKRLAMDIINTVLEGYPKSKKEFLEEVGLETDEDCGVSIPKST